MRDPATSVGLGVDLSTPASHAQRRLWIIDRLGVAGTGYNVALTLRLSGPVDVVCLSAALTCVVQRHVPLRTCLRENDGDVRQHVLPATPMPVIRHVVQRDALPGLIAAERHCRIDLSSGPLLRAMLFEVPGGETTLLLVIHHIAFDGWSAPILLAELATAYRNGGVDRLPPLESSYVEYARRQHASSPSDKDLTYWQNRLREIELLPLPYDQPPVREAPSRAVHLPVHLTAPIRDHLERLARASGTTLFVLALAAFQAFLHRLTGTRRIAVGVPVAGRDESALETLVGLFVNLVVVDADLSDSPDFLTLTNRVREAMLGAIEHRALSFDQLVQVLRQDRASKRNPLFNVAFALQQAPVSPDFGPSLQAGIPEMQVGARFDLELYLWRTNTGLLGTLIADADCFSAATLATIRQSFLVFLARLIAAPDRPISSHDLLQPSVRRSVLDAARPAGRPIPRERLEVRFAAQAARTPGAVAVIDDTGSMSYAELDRLAATMAAGLAADGVRPGMTVALLADRSRHAIAAMIAILRRGAAYLPLDPQQPVERLSAILQEARPALLIGDRAVDGTCCTTLSKLAAGAPGDTAIRLPTDAVAYINYTSGSTGRPKGIAIPHRAVLRLACNQSYLVLGPGRRVGHAASLAFDAVTFELWSTLLSGAAVVVLPRAAVLDPDLLAAAIRRDRIDTLFVTTALFNQIVDTVPDVLPCLEALLFGGEACDPARVRQARATSPSRLLHVYGPTESTTFATWFDVASLPADAADVPIGRPLDNTSAYVLDSHGALVPPGGAGELFIGGDGLAWHYLGDPALTAARFVPDDLSGEPGSRLYRTGDRVRLGPNGTITFLSRIDRQVKIRGFRVEPGEVEAALTRLPGVTGAAVLTRREADGTTSLLAYVAGPALPEPGDLRHLLRAALPDWMLPAAIVTLQRLPLTTNGKLDRAALPEPDSAAAPIIDTADDHLRAEVALLVAENLGLPSVGINDNIFGLGGHSLSMTRLAARLRARFRIELPLAPLFETPTVAAITRCVYQALTHGAPAAMIAEPERRLAPLSFAQGRLWFLHRMGLTGSAYHSPLSLRLSGALDEDALRRAVTGLAERHATLRTVFDEQDGEPRQRILDRADIPLRVVDLTGKPDAAVRLTIEAMAEAPFDLRVDVPLRVALLRLAPREHILTLVFHHIAFDGWSLPVVARDLSALYRQSALPPLPVQYADYAVWQKTWLSGDRMERLLDWWRGQLADLEDLDLPTDFARPEVQSYDGGTCPIEWPASLAADILDFAGAARATPYMVLLAGFIALLHRYTGQTRVTVGAPIANRNLEEVQDLVGFFVNSLVIAVDCAGDPDFSTLLERVRGTVLDAYGSHELPFERLVEALRPQRDLSRHPLFQTVFVLQQTEAMQPVFDLPGLTAEVVPVTGDVAVRFDLEVHLSLTPDRVGGYVFFNRSLFRQTSVERLLGQFRTLLVNLIAAPNKPASMAALESEESLQALEAWSHA